MVAPPIDQAAPLSSAARLRAWKISVPAVLAGLAFVVLFTTPFRSLLDQWWNDPDSGHGLLLFPVALWLAWREGIDPDAKPSRKWGITILLGAILLRALGSAAAELFTQRFSIWLAAVGLVVFHFGWVQIRRWWLPVVLLPLSIPLPAIVTDLLANPLQFKASKLATGMIKWRHIGVVTNGNVITILPTRDGPGATLFVAEACSGLRSLTALLSLGVLIGGMYLRHASTRALLVLLAIPVAVFVNAVRIFLTAFLVHFVDPNAGQGAFHRNEGWVMFMIAFVILGGVASVVRLGERGVARLRGVQDA
jgi:exosortase